MNPATAFGRLQQDADAFHMVEIDGPEISPNQSNGPAEQAALYRHGLTLHLIHAQENRLPLWVQQFRGQPVQFS